MSDGSQFILMTLVSLLPLLAFQACIKNKSKTAKNTKAKKGTQVFFPDLFNHYLAKADPRNWKLWKKPKIITKRTPVKTAKVEKPVLVSCPSKSLQRTCSQPVTIRKNTADKPAAKKLKLPANYSMAIRQMSNWLAKKNMSALIVWKKLSKDDSRGVTICPECGTWHHQDCWSLTGSCGVAHRNEL